MGKALSENLRRRSEPARCVLGPHEADSAQRDNGKQALDQHAAVSDGLSLTFLVDLFRRGARRNQAVEARNRAARNGDEQSREQKTTLGSFVDNSLAGFIHNSSTRGNVVRLIGGEETRERRDLQVVNGTNHASAKNGERSKGDHAVQQIAGQVIARLKENPDRRDRRSQNIHANDDHPRVVVELERMEVETNGDYRHDHDNSHADVQNSRKLTATRQQAPDNSSDNEQNGNRRGLFIRHAWLSERGSERVRDDGRERSNHQQQREIREDAEQPLRRLVNVLLDNRRKRMALVADRGEQRTEVVHGAKENAADQHP